MRRFRGKKEPTLILLPSVKEKGPDSLWARPWGRVVSRNGAYILHRVEGGGGKGKETRAQRRRRGALVRAGKEKTRVADWLTFRGGGLIEKRSRDLKESRKKISSALARKGKPLAGRGGCRSRKREPVTN